ncbi:xanthine dehydrogenase family protein molybdopterin-binding subunit [Pseudogracilibacillus sp. ICA-222130]|uniref:xanthine dehydrogenase family protein molybdopterin-binding subunit n=1 Tax=Pseudogracilibacillus sp. ICA-222130 TaxID=3134655 RepID=UPI0030C42FC9
MIRQSVPRIEDNNKVTGAAKYTADNIQNGVLYARLVTSSHAHAEIMSIDTSKAQKCSGVRAILTGKDCHILVGSTVEDRPILAQEKVRYFGEPIAVVVADSEHEAQYACNVIHVKYNPLPNLSTVHEAITTEQTCIHENFEQYTQLKSIRPNPKQNIANHVKIRKGNMKTGETDSNVIIETTVSLPQSDHAAMETRSAKVEILPNGDVHVHSSSQAPFVIKQMISKYFMIEQNKVIVHTPFVGGAFGGKASIQLEFIAYLASKAVGGRMVTINNPREVDMVTSPVHIGMDATIKLGATNDGKLTMANIQFLFNAGAYVDESSDITNTAALNCTGPYNIKHVTCDSYCIYTNNPYATSFRGYGHSELTFAIERAIDLLAKKLRIDAITLRLKNTIKPGHTTPSQALLTKGNIGNVTACLERVKKLIQWEEGQVTQISQNMVRAKGIACLWKASMSPTNASSGAIITFNKDGGINLNIGVVEIGNGTKTVLAQILAESLQVHVSKINVNMEIDTQTNPKHWKTVASTATHMVGNAVLEAAEDVKRQLKYNASFALHTRPEHLEVKNAKVYVKSNPKKYVNISDVCFGYQLTNGNTVGTFVIGHGGFIMEHLTKMNMENGQTKPAPFWTVGAQAVEVELQTDTFYYDITRAVTVMDAGTILNPMGATGQVMGAMKMGLSMASREGFICNNVGQVLNNQFRSYHMLRFDENPNYTVEFIETPQADGPYGARGLAEHGIVGMPGALANSLSAAVGIPLNQLPLYPEFIWQQKRRFKNDCN